MDSLSKKLYDVFSKDKENVVLYQLLGYDDEGGVMNIGLYESEERAFEVQQQIQDTEQYEDYFLKIYGLELYKDEYFEDI